jgi:uncharacterized membrane protein YfhO
VKYLLGKKDVTLDWTVWELAFEGDPDLNVYRNRRFQPRAHLLGKTIIVPDGESALTTLHDPAFDPLSQVILETGEEMAGANGDATITQWQPNRVAVETRSDAPGTLLLAQVWYPGWQARVDGGAWGPVLRADGAFQAVQLPAGPHTVELRFRSLRQIVGGLIALVTLLVVIIGMLRPLRRQKK